MTDVISEYQKWKQQGDDLRLKAKQAMEARFREVLLEAARIAEEYRTDFGSALKPPAQVTAFRYKTSRSKGSVKAKSTRQKPDVNAQAKPDSKSSKPDPKVEGLR